VSRGVGQTEGHSFGSPPEFTSPNLVVPTLTFPKATPARNDYPDWLLSGVDPNLTLSLPPISSPGTAPTVNHLEGITPSSGMTDPGFG